MERHDPGEKEAFSGCWPYCRGGLLTVTSGVGGDLVQFATEIMNNERQQKGELGKGSGGIKMILFAWLLN